MFLQSIRPDFFAIVGTSPTNLMTTGLVPTIAIRVDEGNSLSKMDIRCPLSVSGSVNMCRLYVTITDIVAPVSNAMAFGGAASGAAIVTATIAEASSSCSKLCCLPTIECLLSSHFVGVLIMVGLLCGPSSYLTVLTLSLVSVSTDCHR